MQNIERMARGDAEPAPLSHREMNDSVVAAEHAAVEVDDVARLGSARPKPFDHLGIAPGWHEADVLAVVLVGNREAEAAGEFARLGLRALAERETKKLKLLMRGGEQKIALVAFG